MTSDTIQEKANALSHAKERTSGIAISQLIPLYKQASQAASTYYEHALKAVTPNIAPQGKIDRNLMESEQRATHGLGWMCAYVETLVQTYHWANTLAEANNFSETDALLSQILFAEYLKQLTCGIPMTQCEIVRPSDLGMDQDLINHFANNPAISTLTRLGDTSQIRKRAAQLIKEAQGKATVENTNLDETLTMVRDQFRKFADEKIVPYAHEWHLKDQLIPINILNEMSELGVFGLTIPEEFGGFGMGKMAMCVVSEELSRGYIGVGSLGTRSEIAAELILNGGTFAQKQSFLPKIASGEILPTAVFTEPNTGSDLGALRTRATLKNDYWSVTGNKTWITHAARSDLMTVLARTKPDTKDFRGLSMFLAEKPRGSNDNPFPADGMTGGEIEVLGYRGMKEYELGFDGFQIPKENLLGGEAGDGMGFKYLMATFEGARIQTAARAIGTAQLALELGLKYALDRQQFGGPIFNFPRVQDKLVMMAAELVGVRQLTYYSARKKDSGQRCDLEAGMAKLIGARVAWAAADNALQIHGGNGFALEYEISRVLCDARILNIFEGAGEVQAMVIARRSIEEHLQRQRKSL
ncbi:acyl-CoA dehydrogenase family protein [Hirschia litorea]|uniref:Acyl-CoA dehydrogenase family protein n=1 Tax=Hirschia litorea TaxID=1199156 RepID=A0ABW2IM74_9PROT